MNQLAADEIIAEQYEAGKSQLLESIAQIKEWTGGLLPGSVFVRELEQLQESIEENFCTVVVLGEFKRGKSTFINGLLGEALLPADVTPTTATLNAIHYGEERSLTVHMQDGSSELRELSRENIDAFSAEGAEIPDKIRYLRMTLPLEMLESKIMLVDTPGVNDLNQQRVEVTYQFVPRADVVIFLLDATSPVTRSEKEFLADNLPAGATGRMLFIANFMDQIDEDPADHVESITKRLAAALGGFKPAVLPYCATLALEGRLSGNDEFLEASGYLSVTQAIRELISYGSQGEMKLERFRTRLHTLSASIARELDGRLALLDVTGEELAGKLESIESLMQRHSHIRLQMENYTRDRETEILAFVRKSLIYFEQQLKEDMEFAVLQFNGNQLKDFIEIQITMQVKRRLKQWIELHSQPMVKLLQMLEQALASALAAEFNTALYPLVNKNRLDGLHSEESGFALTGDDLSNTPIIAGLIAGGAGMLAMLLGGPILLPIVGMAGFPFIQKHMLQDQLKKAKEKLLPELDNAIDQVMEQFSGHVEQWLLNNVRQVREAAEQRYVDIVRMHKIRLDTEISGVKRSLEEQDREKQQLIEARREIELWLC
ncbi:dynamin family protein [Paenibacillus sp. MMS20-IR301]|uniref:dynamin family protein n=1 Tax=Paenibacillus sp. MMS20-IR301 TaxID=2895946 RepID=UPI0028ED19D9|nr:dynamin family protein [Paenibacillus sp. MMS20-IR301]WNS46311.1 dynamin family protein [Paenibacillus sp. MMS20-IR301]